MGIPKFFRWISERYPMINQQISDLSLLPEFDNLYLDMNGIIHACTHPHDEDVSDQISKVDMILGIFAYIDRIVTHIVKPKKLLYMAIDGVAPRAKLNQQRSRRFRSAKDRLEMMNSQDDDEDDDGPAPAVFDSNCITPGTEFMEEVHRHLTYFIRKKIKEDRVWQNLEVIFSGHNVPGEGEHKIMEYIRSAKMQPGYNPDTRHCLYGQDADLIMLALASHEPHFTLLREIINFNRHHKATTAKVVMKQTKEPEWQLLHISLLREYLENDFRMDVPFYDSERVIDDFVFMAFLIGNDFIPHSPLLDIGEGAFPLLFSVYKELLPSWGGYLTKAGEIEDGNRLESFFVALGDYETEVFANRQLEQQKFQQRQRRKDGYSRREMMEEDDNDQLAEDQLQAEFEAALQDALGLSANEAVPQMQTNSIDGKDWKGRYYYEKFGITVADVDVHKQIRKCFLESLVWCCRYYYQGVCSWTWFFPFHYSPMVSDLTGVSSMLKEIELPYGQPLKPFEQLLGCLPPASSNFLPPPYRVLVMSPESPIIGYYPDNFKVDMNGKKNPWEGVNLLPFIDAQKLRKAVDVFHCEEKLTPAEKARNTFGSAEVFTFDSSALSTTVPTSFPEAGFGDIVACQSSVADFVAKPLPAGGFVPLPCKDTTLPYPGFPTMYALPIVECKPTEVKLNCFGSESRYETVVVTIDRDEEHRSWTDGERASSLLNKVVYVSYPCLIAAKVVAVTDQSFRYVWKSDSNKVQRESRRPEEAKKWEFETEAYRRRFLRGNGTLGFCGIDIGEVSVLVSVKVQQGLERSSHLSASEKKFGEEVTEVPLQLIVLDPLVKDPRFEEQQAPSIEELFPIDSQVLGSQGMYAGYQGVVKEIFGPKSLTVEFDLPERPERPFGRMIAQTIVDKYFPLSKIAAKLKLPPDVLGRITGQIILKPCRKDIGLNLKVKKIYQLPGYSYYKDLQGSRNGRGAKGANSGASVWKNADVIRLVSSSDASNGNGGEDSEGGVSGVWEYSERAIQVIAAYQRKFPVIFDNLMSRRNGGAPTFSESDLLKDRNTGTSIAVEEVCQWLSQLESSKVALVPVSSQTLSKDAVKAIEAAVNKMRESTKQVKRTVNNLPVDYVLPLSSADNGVKPQFARNSPTPGDRCVNISATGIPVGLRGTIVATHVSTQCLEVVYDHEFLGGTSLNGFCSKYRGKLVSLNSQLVLSGDEIPRQTAPPPARSSANSSNIPATEPRRAGSQPSVGQVKLLTRQAKSSATSPAATASQAVHESVPKALSPRGDAGSQNAASSENSAKAPSPTSAGAQATPSLSEYFKQLQVTAQQKQAASKVDNAQQSKEDDPAKAHFQSLLEKAGIPLPASAPSGPPPPPPLPGTNSRAGPPPPDMYGRGGSSSAYPMPPPPPAFLPPFGQPSYGAPAGSQSYAYPPPPPQHPPMTMGYMYIPPPSNAVNHHEYPPLQSSNATNSHRGRGRGGRSGGRGGSHSFEYGRGGRSGSRDGGRGHGREGGRGQKGRHSRGGQSQQIYKPRTEVSDSAGAASEASAAPPARSSSLQIPSSVLFHTQKQ